MLPPLFIELPIEAILLGMEEDRGGAALPSSTLEDEALLGSEDFQPKNPKFKPNLIFVLKSNTKQLYRHIILQTTQKQRINL